jgi:hypothetical protein
MCGCQLNDCCFFAYHVLYRVLTHLAPVAIEHNSWGSLITKLHGARELIPPDADTVTAMISHFVEWSVAADPFPVKKICSPSGLVIQPNVDAIVDVALLCLATNNEDAYSKLFNNMHSAFALDPSQFDYRSIAYYIPLMKKLKSLEIKDDPKSVTLSKTTAELLVVLVKSMPAFPIKNTGLNPQEPDIHSIIELLQLCLSLQEPSACSFFFTRMKHALDKLYMDAKVTKFEQYYIPLMQEIEKSIGPQIHRESFAPFYKVHANMFYDLLLPALGTLTSPTATQLIVSLFQRFADPEALISDK